PATICKFISALTLLGAVENGRRVPCAGSAAPHVTPDGSRGSELPTDRRPILSTAGRWTRPAASWQTMQERAPRWQSGTATIKILLTMPDCLKPLFSGLPQGLERVAEQAAAVTALTTLVQQSLAAELRSHVVSAVRRADDLVVIVDSAAWSA